MKPIVASACLVSLLLLVSCGTTARSFVDETAGYSSTKGRLQRVENLSSENHQYLKDGVAVTASAAGATITLKINESMVTLETTRGTIIVYSKSGDYVLQPLSSPAPSPAEPE